MPDREDAVRPEGVWPGWLDDLFASGPLAELEIEYRGWICEAITEVLDHRSRGSSLAVCPCCGGAVVGVARDTALAPLEEPE
jgi:hypothetical protein